MKPSEIFVKAVNEEFRANSGNYDDAWQVCADRTHKSVYVEMMNADTRRRVGFTNEMEAAARRITSDPKAILDEHANAIADFRIAMVEPGWSEWVGTNQSRFKGRAASTVFTEVVTRLRELNKKLSYNDAWTSARTKFAALYENMSA